MARAVASLWEGVTLHAHSRRVSRRKDPEAEDSREHDDGGVSMAMKKTNKSPGGVTVSPVWTGGLLGDHGHCYFIYMDVYGVCLISGGVRSCLHCNGSRIL